MVDVAAHRNGPYSAEVAHYIKRISGVLEQLQVLFGHHLLIRKSTAAGFFLGFVDQSRIMANDGFDGR